MSKFIYQESNEKGNQQTCNKNIPQIGKPLNPFGEILLAPLSKGILVIRR
jgi:hypothetical protein